MFLYLRDETDILSAPTRLLHFAPEPALKAVLGRYENIDYVTTDVEMGDVSLRMDITDILFREDVFDCVICSHVLEHVEDDRAAMAEIGRVLRPDGFALIMVPILRTPEGRTQEDPAIVTPEQRQRAYGQADHVRAYGADFPERVREAGLGVTAVRYAQELGAGASERFGLESREQLFVCRPPSPDEAVATELNYIRDIAPSDTMARPGASEQYYNVGLDALRIVRDAVASTGGGRPSRILDLPCGYGRVLRMLRAAYPESLVTASDTDRRGVEFCERTFGVEGVVAARDPDEVSLPGPYDLIWCGSLLTHLPERAFHSLLALFERQLEPGGVLIFTTHGQMICDLLLAERVSFAIEGPGRRALSEGYGEDGFAFEPYTHSRDGGYGIALTSKSWVLGALGRRSRLELVAYNEADWDGRQDSVVCRAR